MEETNNKRKILLITIPIIVVLIIAIIITTVVLVERNKPIEIRVEIIGTYESYILGSAPAKEGINDPSDMFYRFNSEKKKTEFLENALKDKNIVAEFESEEEKMIYFFDDGNLFGIVNEKDSNKMRFFNSFAYVSCERTNKLLFPMLDYYIGPDKELNIGQSITMDYDEMPKYFDGMKFNSYEEYKTMYDKMNKDAVIAKFDDINKTITLKSSLYSNNKFLAYKKVELTFNYTEIKITYTGEEW